MATPQIEVKIELLQRDRSRQHPPLLPSYYVTMETAGGVWEETVHGRDQLDICLKFLQAGVALMGGHLTLPEIPR